MKKFLKVYRELLKNFLIVMSGTVIATIILLLVSPILTRLYTLSDFGLLAIFVALVSTISIVSTMRYELAVVQPNNQEDATSIVILAMSILTLIVIVSAIFLYLFKVKIQNILGVEDIDSWLYLFPLSVF
jgi:O-antigen/teichoic acid export membrane protein